VEFVEKVAEELENAYVCVCIYIYIYITLTCFFKQEMYLVY